jgi:hypothetical protein
MFGYIEPLKCELKVCEFEIYKAYYCGLCKTLGHEYAFVTSAWVSYDCSFLYLLADSMKNTENSTGPCACLLHPLEKRLQIRTDSASYPAAVNVLLAYYKMKDDIEDGGKAAACALPLIYPAYKKARAAYPEAAEAIRMMHSALGEIQLKKSSRLDEPAGAFGVMLGKLFESLDQTCWEDLYDLGFNLGRWLYIMDAVDDLKKDEKKGNYNAFLEKYKSSAHPTILKDAEFNLYFSLARASQAYGRLPVRKNKGILDNLFYLGLKKKTQSVLEGEVA